MRVLSISFNWFLCLSLRLDVSIISFSSTFPTIVDKSDRKLASKISFIYLSLSSLLRFFIELICLIAEALWESEYISSSVAFIISVLSFSRVG